MAVLEEHDTHRAILGRETVFGVPGPWLIYLSFPLAIGMGVRMYWLLLAIVPLFFWLRSKFKQDEFWVEIALTSTLDQSDEYTV